MSGCYLQEPYLAVSEILTLKHNFAMLELLAIFHLKRTIESALDPNQNN